MNFFFTFAVCALLSLSFAAAALITRQSGSLDQCEFIPTNGKRGDPVYFICDIEMNWHVAQQYCASHGMNLATVDTEEVYNKLAPFTQNFLHEKGFQSTGVWIGGADLGNQGNWYWVSNGQFLYLNKWFPGEPSNNRDGKGEHCLTLWKSVLVPPMGFNDYGCHLNLRFICEAD